MTELNWLEALPFHHEVVHTSVIRHLLRSRDTERATAFARILAEEKSIDSVGNVRFERSLRTRRRLDLVGDIILRSGDQRQLALEMKTDSAWEWEQLWKSAPTDSVAVLAAMGLTYLTIRDSELALIKREHSSCPDWTLVGPQGLADAIAEVFEPRGDLLDYVNSLLAEHALHEAALNEVEQMGGGNGWNPAAIASLNSARGDRNETEDILMTAYLRKALDQIDDTFNPVWRWKKERSGHLAVRAMDDGWGCWLEIHRDGNRGPVVVVKVKDQKSRLATAREATIEALSNANVAGSPPARRVSKSHKTAAAWTVPAYDLHPSELQPIVRELEEALIDNGRK